VLVIADQRAGSGHLVPGNEIAGARAQEQSFLNLRHSRCSAAPYRVSQQRSPAASRKNRQMNRMPSLNRAIGRQKLRSSRRCVGDYPALFIDIIEYAPLDGVNLDTSIFCLEVVVFGLRFLPGFK